MYEVFDDFLSMASWLTSHPLDEDRFYRALATIVTKPDFQPDDMGEYFSESLKAAGKRVGGKEQDAIERYVGMAETIQGYIHATNTPLLE